MSWASKTLKSVIVRAWDSGKATLFTVAVALTLATVTPALAANGGNFLLGKANVATAVTLLKSTVAGPALQVYNPSTSTAATAALFQVAVGHPPFKVNSATKVPNLNADQVDGKDSSQLEGALAYAHIKEDGTLDTSRSKNVNRSFYSAAFGYCINSTVTPRNVVATVDLDSGTGQISTRSDNGNAQCGDGNGNSYNILAITLSSTGASTPRAFYIVIN